MKRNPQPQFLRIRWKEAQEQGAAVTLEAIACLRHRQEIALAYPSARGAGGRGDVCDLCEGRHPRPLEPSPPSRPSQLGSPDGSPARPAALGAPR
jgi:hypothetical protein